MKEIQHSKIANKRSSIAGITPSIGPSDDHTDGSWDSTQVYPGELFFNIPDQRLWIGNIPTPLEITLSGGSNNAVTGGTFNLTAGTITISNVYESIVITGNTYGATGSFTAGTQVVSVINGIITSII